MAGVGFLFPLWLYGQVSITPRIAMKTREGTLPPANLRIDSNLVLIPVSVCDALNRPVTFLGRENFQIFDDRVPQTVTQFAREDEPLAVGMVFDTSRSMGDKLRLSRMAASAFFRTANPEDEFFLVEFSNRPRLVVPMTPDHREIEAELASAQPTGRTALLDAIVMAIQEMKKSTRNRKALLILSDGGDNHSRYTRAEVRDLVQESDVLIYALGIYETDLQGRAVEELAGPRLLSDIARQTGGRHLPVGNLNELPRLAAQIGIELRCRYLLGYSPSSLQRDGRFHRVEVKLAPPRKLPALKAFWRQGYYAPQ
jgi:VWFA-related protein